MSGLAKTLLRAVFPPKPKAAPESDRFVINAKGLVVLALFAAIYERDSKEREVQRRVLTRYCEYLSERGYMDASASLAEVDMLSPERWQDWLKHTYAQYVTDDNELLEVLRETEREAREEMA